MEVGQGLRIETLLRLDNLNMGWSNLNWFFVSVREYVMFSASFSSTCS
jgi:hypothetical protein